MNPVSSLSDRRNEKALQRVLERMMFREEFDLRFVYLPIKVKMRYCRFISYLIRNQK